MTGFAGSNSIDERRRRRLATDWDESAVASTKNVPDAKINIETEVAIVNAALPRYFPLRKIISPKGWKTTLVATFLVSIAILSLLAGCYPHNVRNAFGPGISALFDLKTGSFNTAFSGCLLFLSGQLALLIWWSRSQNMRDFEGTYRIWPYAAITSLIAAGSLFSGAHLAWSTTFHWIWPIPFWKKEIVCWLAPSLAVASSLILALHRDMRDCKTSTSFLWLAAGGWSSAAIISLKLQIPLPDTKADLLLTGLQTMPLYAFLLACYFIHVM